MFNSVWVPGWIRPLLEGPAVAAGRTLFLSDLHWGAGPDARDRLESMKALLRGLPGAIDDLVFGGGTFEFWWEWRRAVPSAHWEFLHEVRKVSDAGVKVRFVAGNHDFAIGPELAKICQAEVHPDGWLLEIAGRRWLAMHGDATAPSERLDRMVRRVLRSGLAQGLWHALHPDIALPMALGVGAGSKRIEPGPAATTVELEPMARSWMREFGLSGVVHGHSHRPLLTEGPEGTYINNGDWVAMRTCVWLAPDKPPRLVDRTREGFPWLSNT